MRVYARGRACARACVCAYAGERLWQGVRWVMGGYMSDRAAPEKSRFHGPSVPEFHHTATHSPDQKSASGASSPLAGTFRACVKSHVFRRAWHLCLHFCDALVDDGRRRAHPCHTPLAFGNCSQTALTLPHNHPCNRNSTNRPTDRTLLLRLHEALLHRRYPLQALRMDWLG